MYCAVCGRENSAEWYEFRGDEDVSGQPQTWVLCAACAQDVWHELERTRLRSPSRVHVAIAMVASERAQAAAAAASIAPDQSRHDPVERLLIGTVLAAFLVHALAFVLVIAFIAVGR
jgi:hypothetical protein